MPDPRANSLLLGSVFAVSIFISVVLRRGKTRRGNLFVLFCGSLALWYVLDLVQAWRPATHWRILADGAPVLLPQMAMRFFTAFLGDEPKGSRLVPIGTALGFLVLAGTVSPLGHAFLQGRCSSTWAGCCSRRCSSSSAAPGASPRGSSARASSCWWSAARWPHLLPRLPAGGGRRVPAPGADPDVDHMYTLSQALLLYRLLDV